MVKKPRILILGAGVYQIPLIKKAKQRGYEVLVASIAGNYPGIVLADRFFDIDITDIEGVLDLAETHRISAILTTGSDVSMPAIGAVVDRLELVGPSRHIVETVISKTSFRAFLHDNGFNISEYAFCQNASHALDFYQKLNDKIVIKPDDSSGSRGVTVLERGLEMNAVTAAYENAIQYSRNKRVCTEVFLDGNEVGGDAFFLNGDLIFFTTTHKHLNGVLVQGHTLPGNLSMTDSLRVKNEIAKIARILGYKNGPMNFDVMVNDKDIYVLELALRNGGNGIVDLIYHSEGVDLTEWLLDYALGIPIVICDRTETKEISSYVFGAERTGILKSVSTLNALQKNIPQIFEMILAKNVNDKVDAFVHNANLIGYLLMNCGSADYEGLCRRIRNFMQVEVE